LSFKILYFAPLQGKATAMLANLNTILMPEGPSAQNFLPAIGSTVRKTHLMQTTQANELTIIDSMTVRCGNKQSSCMI